MGYGGSKGQLLVLYLVPGFGEVFIFSFAGNIGC